MAATIMDGKALAAKVQAEVARDVADFGQIGLATVLVGDDPASHIYIRRKHEAAQEVGIRSDDRRLPADISQEDLLAVVEELNGDDSIHGVLVQSPLPDHLDEELTISTLDPAKDVDGFHPLNAGALYLGQPKLVPATPLGVMRLLEEYEVEISGARALVIGRSTIVGKPMAHLLLGANATVTIAHSRTRDLPAVARRADVLVAAVGRAEMVRGDWVKPGAVVIDVGINRTEQGIVGDVAFAEAAEHARAITPVPGGVGPMTIACLLRNTLKAAKMAAR
jgi:methylenetetrahydrofolate dehydrogenase (NADP+)/methenyltetrahydrofolate cyclohydrolase